MKKMLMSLLSIIAVAFLETILEILKDEKTSDREMDEPENEKFRYTDMSRAIRVPRENYTAARMALREKGLI